MSGVQAPAKRKRRPRKIDLPLETLIEAEAESIRQERSLSWIFQWAWKLARKEIRRASENRAGGARGRTPVGGDAGPGGDVSG